MKKWNWGKGIIAGIAIFVGIWIGILYFIIGQKVDLVTPNYYEKELKYQQEIDSKRNSVSLVQKVNYELNSDGLRFIFPVKEVGSVSGTVLLYRPSDSKYDKLYQISADTSGIMLIPVAGLRSGKWVAKLEWKSSSQKYSDSFDIMVP